MKPLFFNRNYSITEDGRVWSHRSGKFLSLGRCSNGYLAVSLGRGARYLVHRLVADTYVPRPDDKDHVNHKNGVRDDNQASNLEWVTPSENHIHAHRSLSRKPHAKTRAVAAHSADGTSFVFPSMSVMAAAIGVVDGAVASAASRNHRCRGFEVRYV